MYAVIRTGGKQYRVVPDEILTVEKLAGSPGDVIEFTDVLMLGTEGEPQIGTPVIAGASVSAEVVEQGRGEKIIIFKKRRRQNYRRRNGHRQDITTVRILEILTDGKKSKKLAAAEKAKTEKGAEAGAEEASKPKKAKAKPAEPAAEEKAAAPKPKAAKPKAEAAEAPSAKTKPAAKKPAKKSDKED